MNSTTLVLFMIKLSYDIKKYRQDLLDLINDNDIVIELGCHIGGTTKLISKKCNVIAVDNSPEAVNKMSELEGVDFISGDATRFWLKLFKRYKNAMCWQSIWVEVITQILFLRCFIFGHPLSSQNILLSEIVGFWNL